MDCEGHQYCTQHRGEKYEKYERSLRAGVESVASAGNGNIEFSVNPGPQSHGMNCRRVVHNSFLWTTVAMDPVTRRWHRETTFRYPRIGAFEVYVCKGKKRIEVFSKLKKTRWPNTQWLCGEVARVVEEELGGWEPEEDSERPPRPTRQYAGINGKRVVTDEELRKLLKEKFSTMVSAFRAFDKNGDGCISKTEFIKGLRNIGVDLPPEVFERLWKMADEDNSGNIHYQEFARKFCTYKASHSLHRHADLRDGDETVLKLHGVGAASRIQKHAAARESEDLQWEVDAAEFAKDTAVQDPATLRPQTIAQLARQEGLRTMKIEEMSLDQIRARIYLKHGNLLNAFRHFDLSGDSRISYNEFIRALPIALGEPISIEKVNEVWRAMDTDGTGEIDIQEFSSEQLVSSTRLGAQMMKGLTVDCTAGERPSHHKHTGEQSATPSGGFAPAPGSLDKAKPASFFGRPESASTFAGSSVRERPQSAKSITSQAESRRSFDEYSDSGFEATSENVP